MIPDKINGAFEPAHHYVLHNAVPAGAKRWIYICCTTLRGFCWKLGRIFTIIEILHVTNAFFVHLCESKAIRMLATPSIKPSLKIRLVYWLDGQFYNKMLNLNKATISHTQCNMKTTWWVTQPNFLASALFGTVHKWNGMDYSTLVLCWCMHIWTFFYYQFCGLFVSVFPDSSLLIFSLNFLQQCNGPQHWDSCQYMLYIHTCCF